MKTKISLLMVLSLSIYFSSCDKNALKVTPSTDISSVTYSVSGFNALFVSDVFQANVSFVDQEESLVIEANSNLHQVIKIDQADRNLSISIKENTNISGPAVLHVFLKAKSLQRINVSGVAEVSLIDTLKGVNLDIDVRDASRLRGPVSVENISCDMSGATKLDLSGNANYFQVSGEGAAEMTGFDFTSNQLNANLYDACELSLTVNESLKVVGEGSTRVYYKGSGVISSMNVKDASQVIHLD